MAYSAFISYSHAADGRLAPALQRAFHRFARPVLKLRALRVFRDKESLSANPALWAAIEQALSQSEHFVLLASPEAARSHWVAREVQWWIDNRSVAKQLIVLTDGDIVWDAGGTDFDWDRTTALPSVVRGRFSDEPLWVDLRWAKTADDLSLRHPQFRAAVLDLAAPLHGKPKDELDSEDVRQYRKTRLLARSAVALLTALTLTAILLAVYAVRQRDEAVRQRDVALSRQAGAQSLRVLDANLDTALLLAVEASRRADTFDARNALLSALGHTPFLVSFLPGHRAAVTAVAFSPDGRTLASGSSDDGAVVFWDVDRRSTLGAPVVAHREGVTRLAFSPDGRVVASAGRDGTVQLWDVAARRPLGMPLAGHTDAVARLSFSADGRTLASGDDGGSIVLWDVATRTTAGPPLAGEHRGITALAFDATGSVLASGDGFGTVVTWDLRTPERVGASFFDGRFFVMGIEFAPSGNAVATGLSNTNLIRWDVGQTQPRALPISTSNPSGVAARDTRAATIDSSGRTLAVAEPNGAVIVADIAADGDQPLPGKATLEELRPGSGILAVALSSDGRHVASGYRDGTLALWDVTEQHALARSFEGRHHQDVTAIAFAPQGMTLVSGSFDKTLMFWDIAARRSLGPALEGHPDSVASVEFSPSGALMASSGYDGAVHLWDVASRRPLDTAMSGHHKGRVNRVVFSPDGTVMATAGADDRLRLWDVKTRQPQGPPLEAKQQGVASAAFSPDGKLLVSGGVDGTVALWDLTNRRPLGAPVAAHGGETVNAVAFSSDGMTIASVGRDARLNLFGVTERRSLGPALVLDPIDMDHRQGVGGAVVFSPDGRMVISGGNGRIVLWDRASGQPLESVLRAWGQGANTRLAISPDGMTLAASSGDTVVLWEVGLSGWQRQACRLANRDLTREEWNTFIGAELPYRSTCSERSER